jgi:DNA-3-methyladenine glycosylase II
MKMIEIPRPRGFSLSAATAFYSGFLPGAGMAAAATDELTLAFRLDDTFEAVAVALSESDTSVKLEFEGTDDVDRVRAQIGRMLGLSEGDAWLALGAREPIVGELQDSFPGFFTAAKASPYDAAAWGVIVPRINMKLAAKIKMSIAAEHGDVVKLLGREHVVFPAPARLIEVTKVAGLTEEKLGRLHAIAMAALDGRLSVERLVAMGETKAIADLTKIRGVGPWTASHIYFRGAAPRDGLPKGEPRVFRGFGELYGVDGTEEAFEKASDNWRPYRMWVSILLARHLKRVGGWDDKAIGDERAAALRRVAKRVRSAA